MILTFFSSSLIHFFFPLGNINFTTNSIFNSTYNLCQNFDVHFSKQSDNSSIKISVYSIEIKKNK